MIGRGAGGWFVLVLVLAYAPPLLAQPTEASRRLEIVEMLASVFGGGKMGPGSGWFHPSQSRQGWDWLAERCDKDRDGAISWEEFGDRMDLFDRLDRNKDRRLTAEDFDWPAAPQPKSPPPTNAKKEGSGPSLAVLLKGLATGELGSPFEGPDVGELAPDFALHTHDGKKVIRLSQYRGHKPVVLIFGSFT